MLDAGNTGLRSINDKTVRLENTLQQLVLLMQEIEEKLSAKI